MPSRFLAVPAALLAAVLCATGASAQTGVVEAPVGVSPAGWSFAPSLSFNGTWDDNALITSVGDNNIADYSNVLNPRGELAYRGRRGDFAAAYDGSFVGYRQLNTLNSYSQRASVGGRQRVTRSITLFGRGSVTSVPSTELLDLIAVPFVRLGSRLAESRAGAEVMVTRRTSIEAAHTFQWVDFDEDAVTGLELVGGHSHGASVGLRHAITPRTALTANYTVQNATVLNGETFGVQNAEAGAEYRLSEHGRISGAAGIARLGLSSFSAPQTGLALRAGYTHAFETTLVIVGYSRAFVPSYSFGGTSENEELTASAHAPLARRLYTQSGFAWRRNQSLAPGEPRLRSVWIDAAIGYLVQPWIQVEGFYTATRQRIAREDGHTNRNLIGFRVIATKPLRIR